MYLKMALSSPSSSLLPNSSSSSTPFPFLHVSSNTFITLKPHSTTPSHQTIELENQRPHTSTTPNKKKTKQKLRPSFYQQIRHKWSLRIDSQRQKFPWQEQGQHHKEELENEVSEQIGETPLLNESAGFSQTNQFNSPPWVTRKKFEKKQNFEKGSSFNGDQSKGDFKEPLFIPMPDNQESSNLYSDEVGISQHFDSESEFEKKATFLGGGEFLREESEKGVYVTSEGCEEEDRVDGISSLFGKVSESGNAIQLPWESKSDLVSVDGSKWRKSKADFAEKTIPETELKRLRNVSLRMKERIKVGSAGVTQALVDKIHEKWKGEEVVKMRFEGPPAFNMKRTHETLESRTGGVVIWRAGSSLVLYRGMSYNLPCVQQYTKLSQANRSTSIPLNDLTKDVVEEGGMNDAAKTHLSPGTRAAKSFKKPSEELMDIGDLNHLLDKLGPRFIDWSGPEPLPVDADLLPSVVPGYRPPFRVLPYRVRAGLGNKQMTSYRRLARISPPHFALGRNRELQGLAMAMVKLWEQNAIAKIAIKRGVLNTRNERMAEELKNLTGGTLLSRNKEYIVFYRGNDFLSPLVTETLLERQKLVEVQQEKEEIARDRASFLFISKPKFAKGPLVAGTLAETLAAKSRWGNEPSSEDLEKMKREYNLAKHASLVTYLEKKIVRAQDKVNRAENALRKVQEFLIPTELPSDLETITDEERLLFRKMGLSMRPFLLVGRREVFDGTVENMHLHWKHRELVKIIVRGRNFLQVKHIAISLEAESGGLLVSVDKTTKGYAIIFYRGKNYRRPRAIKPKNLLTKRQALARSIELQRREALIHHIADVRKSIELLKSGLDQIESDKKGDTKFDLRLKDTYFSDDDFEDEGEEAYLETYNDGYEDEEDFEDQEDTSVKNFT